MPEQILAQVREAIAGCWPLKIVGGNTKAFYGRNTGGDVLHVSGYQGVVSYEPSELVVTARCGTRLAELQAVLAAEGQMLAFEPPRFGDEATVGGTVASGLSGPRRAYAGSLRDFVLGVRCINGAGELLRFGGHAMKNVAGFDVSRLMVGAMGTLGVVVEVTFKLLPQPETEITLRREEDLPQAIVVMNRWAAQPLPLSAACHDGEALYVRLSGVESAVDKARRTIGGDPCPEGDDFWRGLREQQLPFFGTDTPLWRISVPPAAAPTKLPGDCIIDWGGAQRWVKTEADAQTVRAIAADAGGHATLFRNPRGEDEVFAPLPPVLKALHLRIKQAFDPKGLFNPGRLYPDL